LVPAPRAPAAGATATDRVADLPARLAVRLLLWLLVFVIPLIGIVTFIRQYLLLA